jgi:hypothetical protein
MIKIKGVIANAVFKHFVRYTQINGARPPKHAVPMEKLIDIPEYFMLTGKKLFIKAGVGPLKAPIKTAKKTTAVA